MLQRAIQASGFTIDPEDIALLDKGQRSVKGLTSGTEHVVTADLVITLRKSTKAMQSVSKPASSARQQVREFLSQANPSDLRTPSRAYLHVIRSGVRANADLQALHLSEVLATLRSMGFTVNHRTGALTRERV